MRGACLLLVFVFWISGCGDKKEEAPKPQAKPPKVAPANPNQQAGERVQREVRLGYLTLGVTDVDALPGEDLDGDGTADLSRLEFDTQVRLQQLILARQLGIGFGHDVLKAEQARRFTTSDGKVNTTGHQRFLEQILPANGLTVEDWDRFVANELALIHMNKLMSLAGALLPGRVVGELFARDHEEFGAEVIRFPSTNHVADIQATPAALEAFYNKNLKLFRLPEQLEVVRVRIPFSLYEEVSQKPLESLEKSVRAIYKERGAEVFKDKDGKPLPAEEVYPKIRRMLLAQRRFNVISAEVLKGVKSDVARLRAVMAADKAEPKLEVEGLTLAVGSGPVARMAASLEPGQLASGAVYEEDALSLVGLARRFQPPTPKFSDLGAERLKVIRAEFVTEQAQQAAVKRGRGFYQMLTNRMAKGETIEAVAASVKLEVESLPSFALADLEWPKSPIQQPVSIGVAQAAANALLHGSAPAVGEFVPQPWGGFILHLKTRTPPTPEVSRDKFKGYREELLAGGLAAARQPGVHSPAGYSVAPGPRGWFLSEWERLRLAFFVDLKGGDASQANAVTAARQRLREWPEPLGAETLSAPAALPGESLAANDALLRTGISTNVIPAATWLKMADSHPGTAAARRAALIGAVTLYRTGKPAEAASHFEALASAKVDPLTPVARLGLAVCLDSQDDPGTSDAYRRVIKDHPHGLPGVIARLGLAAREQDSKLCQEVIETDPVGYWARLASGLRQRLP
ncbi:MAG: hypothetical protein CMO74_08795 [Verrucomicrobiales bacterium]|nr:hypothetical protein [Verrucomicrobiales bacterium]